MNVNPDPQAAVIALFTARKPGVSQYSSGVCRRAIPRVKGLRSSMLPHAVPASQPKDSTSLWSWTDESGELNAIAPMMTK